jgi:hypothetical protein
VTRVAELQALSDADLNARREELAERVDRLWGELDLLDDEVMTRRRAARRAHILAAPPELEVADPAEEPVQLARVS